MLKVRVASGICRVLGQTKTKTDCEYLGCSIAEFKAHLESGFQAGMNWDNYGKWHIDHIIPLKFHTPVPTIDIIKTRLHYTNTQPLWASDNISKGSRWVG